VNDVFFPFSIRSLTNFKPAVTDSSIVLELIGICGISILEVDEDGISKFDEFASSDKFLRFNFFELKYNPFDSSSKSL
jgi:hypothetical protein